MAEEVVELNNFDSQQFKVEKFICFAIHLADAEGTILDFDKRKETKTLIVKTEEIPREIGTGPGGRRFFGKTSDDIYSKPPNSVYTNIAVDNSTTYNSNDEYNDGIGGRVDDSIPSVPSMSLYKEGKKDRTYTLIAKKVQSFRKIGNPKLLYKSTPVALDRITISKDYKLRESHMDTRMEFQTSKKTEQVTTDSSTIPPTITRIGYNIPDTDPTTGGVITFLSFSDGYFVNDKVVLDKDYDYELPNNHYTKNFLSEVYAEKTPFIRYILPMVGCMEAGLKILTKDIRLKDYKFEKVIIENHIDKPDNKIDILDCEVSLPIFEKFIKRFKKVHIKNRFMMINLPPVSNFDELLFKDCSVKVANNKITVTGKFSIENTRFKSSIDNGTLSIDVKGEDLKVDRMYIDSDFKVMISSAIENLSKIDLSDVTLNYNGKDDGAKFSLAGFEEVDITKFSSSAGVKGIPLKIDLCKTVTLTEGSVTSDNPKFVMVTKFSDLTFKKFNYTGNGTFLNILDLNDLAEVELSDCNIKCGTLVNSGGDLGTFNISGSTIDIDTLYKTMAKRPNIIDISADSKITSKKLILDAGEVSTAKSSIKCSDSLTVICSTSVKMKDTEVVSESFVCDMLDDSKFMFEDSSFDTGSMEISSKTSKNTVAEFINGTVFGKSLTIHSISQAIFRYNNIASGILDIHDISGKFSASDTVMMCDRITTMTLKNIPRMDNTFTLKGGSGLTFNTDNVDGPSEFKTEGTHSINRSAINSGVYEDYGKNISMKIFSNGSNSSTFKVDSIIVNPICADFKNFKKITSPLQGTRGSSGKRDTDVILYGRVVEEAPIV